MPCEERETLLRDPARHGLRKRPQVRKPSLCSLLYPLFGVAVSVEQDPLVICQHLLQDLPESVLSVMLRNFLQCVTDRLQHICDRRVQNDVRVRDRQGRSGHTEFEFVSGKCERGRPVPVRRIPCDMRQDGCTRAHLRLPLSFEGHTFLQSVQYKRELLPEENGNDCRRSLISSQSVIVPGCGDGNTENLCVLIDRRDDRDQEGQEGEVVTGMLSRVQEVDARIRLDRPVVMLAGSVNSLEGLLMEQAGESMLVRHLLHHLHGQLVVVDRDVRCLKDRCQLMLRGRDLIMFCLGRNAELPELLIQIMHERRDLRFQDTEVMILHFLSFRRGRSQQSPSAEKKVFPLLIHILVDEEIFLLGSDRRRDPRDILLADQMKDFDGLFAQGFHGAKKRRLLIQRLAAIGNERRRNIQRAILDKSRRGRVPCGIAAGLEGRAESA